MDLIFEKKEQYFGKDAAWVSEFEVTSDFNLHVERISGGRFLVYQKSVADGEYDLVDGLGYKDHKDVIDITLWDLVYPKYIKVVSEAEVTRAVVLPEGVAKQTGGVKSEYDMSKQEDIKALYGLLESLQKDSSGKVQNLPEFNVANWYEGSGSAKARNAWLEYEGKYLISTEMGEFALRSEDGEYWVDIEG